MNAKPSVEDQRQVVYILHSLETEQDESVLERDVIRKALDADIAHPDECITELIHSKHVYRIKAPSGFFIRKAEK